MQIDSAKSLIQALRASGLFDSEQLRVVIEDLDTVRGDIQTHLKYLVHKKRITVYQLRKVINGKAPELFIGSYVIMDKVGEGGMGKVYRAKQVLLDREVALKIVRPNLVANKLVRKRYDREVETASALHHTNIVSVFDAGEVAGRYYLAMEFVDGIDLARLMREYRVLEVAEACEYARQAALGLQYAHDQGFVHRDIKPSNIIVAGERHLPQATEPAIVKILDMGLVRSVGFDDGGGGDLTRAGTVVGTPDYMAPEQAKNSSGVDHRADLYSLGCTMYFLLSGQPPFPTGTPIEKLLKHQLEATTPLQALRPEVPTSVAEVVAKLLLKKPDLRFNSAGEVAEILAPLTHYPPGSKPVLIHSKKGQAARSTAETLAPAGRSTIPHSPANGSSFQPDPIEAQPIPIAQPVTPPDATPRPQDLPKSLHAGLDNDSPFSSLTELPSEPLPVVTQSTNKGQLSQDRSVWIAMVLILLIGISIGFWIFFGHRKRNQDNPTGAVHSLRQNQNAANLPCQIRVGSNRYKVAIEPLAGFDRQKCGM
jgi:serine/threonine protein kinase